MKQLIILVRKRLWSHGYSVRTAMAGEGFDLVVEGSYRLRVIKGNKPSDIDRMDMPEKGCAYAMVLTAETFRMFAIGYVGADGKVSAVPSDIFGVPASKKLIEKNTHVKEKNKKGAGKKEASVEKESGRKKGE